MNGGVATHRMDIFLFIWFLTLHGVNTAMYLAVTRVAHGWAKTLLGLGVFYGCVALALTAVRRANVGPEVFAPYSYAFTFGCWLAVTVVLSRRGTRQGSFFAAVLCGAHQLAMGIICHALMARVRPEGLSKMVASVLMMIMGAGMIRLLLPRVRRLSRSVDWRLLNVVACILLALVYVTGFCPIWVAGGSGRAAIPFAVAIATLASFFPMVFHLSEKCQAAVRLAQAGDNARLMAEEMRLRREAIDAARRQRHDSRHHRIVIAEHLLSGHIDRALDYLERLDQEADRTPTDKFIWCENDTLNAILSGLSRKAKAKGVAFEVTANVEREVNLPDVDVVAVVANLVENAINAAGEREAKGEERNLAARSACQLPQGGGSGQRNEDRNRHCPPPSRFSTSSPLVTVALRQREQTMGMTVTNPVPEGFALSEAGLPCETPGIGLESVFRVIDRHRGEIVYALAGGVLTCQAVMRIR